MKKRIFLLLSLCILVLLLFACTSGTVSSAPEADPVSLSVDASKAKYWYVSGAEIDPAGLVITAALSDGSVKEIAVTECTYDKPPFVPYGEKEVIVHFGELSATYPIYTCPSTTETEKHTTYLIRKNENGKQVTLTASLVDQETPFVLILPGGGYTTALPTGNEGCGYADRINALGYNAFVLEYSTQMQHPAPLDDVDLAYEIIEQNRDFFGVTMDNYAVCGSSAGGHLAGTWCTENVGYAHYNRPRPAAAILVYPVISFVNKSDGETQNNLIGNDPSKEIVHALSIDEHVSSNYPPTYLWVFVEDGLMPDTELMEKTLENAGVPHIARYFHGGRHGIGLAEGTEAEGWLDEAIAFWRENWK